MQSTPSASRPGATWPGTEWPQSSPESMQIDPKALRQFIELTGGNGVLIVRGRAVAHWGRWDQRGDVASAAKTVYAHLLYLAIQQGLIAGVDEPVVHLEPRLADLNPQWNHKDRQITWRHLATQTSCYGLQEAPGTAFAYNDYSMALFVDLLFQKLFKARPDQFDSRILTPWIAKPLGFQDSPTLLAFGPNDRPGRLAISPRDFARFAWLYMHDGVWRNRQILSPVFCQLARHNPLPLSLPRTAGLLAAMLDGQRSMGSTTIPDNQCDHDGSYSWLWWVNGINRQKRRNWPALPHDTFGAIGHYGLEGVLGFPTHQTVLSWNNTRLKQGPLTPEATEALARVLRSVQPDAGVLRTDPRNAAWLTKGANRTTVICGPGDPEGFLYRGRLKPDGTRDGDQMQLIDKLAGTGANCIYMIAVRSHGGDGDRTENPFIQHDPSRGLNPAVLDQWDGWFHAMDERGIVIYLFLYDDSTRIWNTGKSMGDPERRLVTELVTRFRKHRGLVWCIAEEYQEALTPERVRAIAATIRRLDPVHSIAVHTLHGIEFNEFADDRHVDQFAVQYNTDSETELHRQLVNAWKTAKGRYHINMSECAAFGPREVARGKMWACLMAGASVMIIDMDIASTDIAEMEDCGRAVRFWESFHALGFAPADERVLAGTQYAMAAPDGRFVLYGRSQNRRLGLRDLPKRNYDLLWMDCTTGQWTPQISQAGGPWDIPPGIGNEAVVYGVPTRTPSP